MGHGFLRAFPGLDTHVSSFALCGAAALAGASTQTISSGVIAIELTGEYKQQLPIFLAVLAAYTISRGLSQSIYDALTLRRIGGQGGEGGREGGMEGGTEGGTEGGSDGGMVQETFRGEGGEAGLKEGGRGGRKGGALLASPVDLRKAPDISVDPSAFRVSELTPLSDVYALFDLIRCNRVFVVSYGVLVGVISRRILITNITHLNQEPNPGNPSLLFAMGRSTSSLPTPPSSFRARSRRGSGATASLRQRSRQNSLSTSGSSLPTGPSSTSSSASPFSARSSSNGRLQSWVRYRLFGAGKKEGKKAKNAREDQEEEEEQQQQQQLDEK
ncbi:cystathionine beta-core [Nannochloropsis oceanica]